MKNKQEVRTLGRLVARELTYAELEKITGQMCVTGIGVGSRCLANPLVRDFAP